PSSLSAQSVNLLDHACGISHRVRVRHRMHGGEATSCSGSATGLDGFGIIITGLTQVGVEVNQSGQDDFTAYVNDFGGLRREVWSKLGDRAVSVNANIGLHTVGCGTTGEEISESHGVAFHCPGWPASSRYRTAMRMETPLLTCSSAVFWGESAAAAEI